MLLSQAVDSNLKDAGFHSIIQLYFEQLSCRHMYSGVFAVKVIFEFPQILQILDPSLVNLVISDSLLPLRDGIMCSLLDLLSKLANSIYEAYSLPSTDKVF